jgi:hypothetical protein
MLGVRLMLKTVFKILIDIQFWDTKQSLRRIVDFFSAK